MVSLGSAAKIIQRSGNLKGDNSNFNVGNDSSFSREVQKENELFSDQFLSFEDLFSPKSNTIKHSRKKITDDIFELTRNNRWEDIISLYHPVEEKMPDLVKAGQDNFIRQKIAFAMGHLNRFDEAIKELLICVKSEPDNFYVRSSLAYTAYDSLYAAKNRDIFLAGQAKAKRIELAHANFRKAQEIRPDGVTNFYRQAMLFSQIENKENMALPLFQKACANWENLDDAERLLRHQEKKNYIKSLYRTGSLLLKNGDGKIALEKVTLCLALDEKTNYVSLSFKYFALGKVQFYLGEYEKARDALLFAGQSSSKQKLDFVAELLARTYLSLGRKDKALNAIETIPERMRRAYFRWTEADVLCALQKFNNAKQVLKKSMERDNRSRHKSLIRLVKIEYLQRDFKNAMEHASEAVLFFREKWQNPYGEGLFWQSLAAFRLGHQNKAEKIALELQQNCRFYPKLDRLLAMIKNEKKHQNEG
ncbi:MAG: tetratricopeptide repeat protein [Thermodesulfobacteriota bacterium]|nr:tetratricopeptide repeat protein [Thermodesulfobacteriota bacterium]